MESRHRDTEPPNADVDRMLTELAHLARDYRNSRSRFEESLLVAYDAGLGPTAIAKAVGHLSEGGVRMLVKRRKFPGSGELEGRG